MIGRFLKMTLASALAVSTAPIAAAGSSQGPSPDSAAQFQSAVGPLVQKKCIACHNSEQRSGGLDLSSGTAARKGGLHHDLWVPGDPTASLIYQRVSSRQMPPGMPLSTSEIEAIRRWIESGAVWKTEAVPTKARETPRAGADWWSLQKVRRAPLPNVKDRFWVANPIDAFVLANLERHSLRPALPADRTTLIRRATFDMLGVPPSPVEVHSFAQDRSPNAYAKVVDRLLADPRYGERWGRHWLDVARFAESQGFERDAIRDHAWPYRDYVVRSLNSDKPYDRFVREQIAGDVLPSTTPDTIAATGFLVAGPFDEAGSGAASAILKAQIREEELEDMLGAVGQTFLGLTVNCARCHDHKFDPILQRDYYRLKAVFEGIHGGDRPFPLPTEEAARSAERTQIRERADSLSEEIRLIEAGARTKADLWDVPGVPLPLARWSFFGDAQDDIGGLRGSLHGGAAVSNGRLHLSGAGAYVETQPLRRNLSARTIEAWVILPNRVQRGGAVLSIQTPAGAMFDGLVYGERQPRKWTAGSSLFERTKDLDAPTEDSPNGAPIHLVVTYDLNNRITLYRNGTQYGESYVPDGPNGSLRTFKAGEARVLLGLRHSGAGNGFLAGDILEARLYDRALIPQQVKASYLAGMRKRKADAATPKNQEQVFRLAQLTAERDQLDARLGGPPPVSSVYAARPLPPGPTYLLLRGDVQAHGDLVSAGGVTSLGASDFGLRPDAPEAERRLHLADWLVRSDNPLTARVMVNRVWHYHFGRGLVGTPNDFGYNGEKPTHPELLDWLAATFTTGQYPPTSEPAKPVKATPNPTSVSPSRPLTPSPAQALAWRLKPLHRLILMSNTYQQSSAYNAKAASRDSEDRWLWRFAPRRLEGEAIRDAMLVVSGRMNWERGGPGFRPFVETVNNSHFYATFDKDGPEYNRRTIYRINVNSAKSTLLDTLDCPDPSTKTPRRSVTTTPLQALELMNNRFVLEQARFFGMRVRQEAGADPAKQADLAYALALGRPPTPDERQRASALIRTGSADTLCWALLNSSEFLVIR